MARQSNSNLLERAQGVKSELLSGANTATRIGQLLLDILASTAFDWDPDRTYAPGEYVLWDNRNVRCFLATLKGESPATHPAKWDDKVISSPAMLLPTGVDYPVLSHAMIAFVKSEVAKGGGNGGNGLNKADREMMNNLVNNTAYVTPYLVGLVLEQIISLINEIKAGADSLLTIANKASTDDLDTVFAKLIAKGKTETIMALCQKLTAVGCGGTVLPGVAMHRFRNFKHYEFVDSAVIVTPPVLDPSYIGRYDTNNCDEFSGWFVDINNPNAATSVRIERDGVVIARIAATRMRDDVRLALINQQKLSADVTYNIYGYVYNKTISDRDGQPHKFEAFGGSSQTKATTDTGAPATVTCGSVVTNPNPNNPPRIVGTYKDQEVYAAGDQLLDAITGLFADDDALTYSATMGNGDPLMAGISFTPGDAKPFKILASFPNQQQPITLIATDTAGNQTPKTFLLTVARQVVISDPVTVVSRAFGGDTECIEGNGARVRIINTMSNGAKSDYTGGGTYRILAPYPDEMTITRDANAVGIIATKETVVADVEVTLEFKFPDETTIQGKFTVRNKVVASSPIVGYIITDTVIPEGRQGVAQVYAVHQDGNWTEITQADGSKFELIAPYPDGMSVSYGNTARALISTAGNSVTANVDVTLRFTFSGGGTVQGKVTVQNVDPVTNEPTTPTTPTTPTQDVYIEKVGYYVNSVGSGNAADSLGFYYKGPVATYKFFIESETTRGEMELYTQATNDPTVSLNPPVQEYNHRIIQALATRIWRGKNYKCRIDIVSGNTVLQSVPFTVTVTTSGTLTIAYSI